jgi:hypothetical protein
MFAMVLGQAQSTDAAVVVSEGVMNEKLINLPGNISLTGNPSVQGMAAGADKGTSGRMPIGGMGIHWDTCARFTLLPTSESFISWDKTTTKYTIVGAVGNTTSTSAGEALIGFRTIRNIIYWYPVKSICVKAMNEPLVGAVDAAEQLGIDTVVSRGASRIDLPNGESIALDTSTGVTRCKHLVLYDPKVHGPEPHIERVGVLHPSSGQANKTREVTARAATLVDRVRMQGKDATDDDRFMSWTKRCCGLWTLARCGISPAGKLCGV